MPKTLGKSFLDMLSLNFIKLEELSNINLFLFLNKIESAIKKSVELLKREDFKDYNIIDLRIHGKIIVE